MDLLTTLGERAKRDGELVARNQRHGDDASLPRTVQFELVTDSQERAEEAGAFVRSCAYGDVLVSDHPGWSLTGDMAAGWHVIVRVEMPTTSSPLRCVSALMLLLACQFGLRYKGWACQLRTS